MQCECIWFGLLFLTFLLSLGWLYVVLILLNDLHNFNECVTDPQCVNECVTDTSADMSTYSPPRDSRVLGHPQPCLACPLPSLLENPSVKSPQSLEPLTP